MEVMEHTRRASGSGFRGGLPTDAQVRLAAKSAAAGQVGRLHAVTIVIPAFNEAGAIARVVEELSARYPSYEILVVDDGSRDETGALAAAAGARFIRHDWNQGVAPGGG